MDQGMRRGRPLHKSRYAALLLYLALLPAILNVVGCSPRAERVGCVDNSITLELDAIRVSVAFRELAAGPARVRCVIVYKVSPFEGGVWRPDGLSTVLSEAFSAGGDAVDIVGVVPVVVYGRGADLDGFSIEALGHVLQANPDCDLVVFPYAIGQTVLEGCLGDTPDCPPLALLDDHLLNEPYLRELASEGRLRMSIRTKPERYDGRNLPTGRVPRRRYRAVFDLCFELRTWPAEGDALSGDRPSR